MPASHKDKKKVNKSRSGSKQESKKPGKKPAKVPAKGTTSKVPAKGNAAKAAKKSLKKPARQAAKPTDSQPKAKRSSVLKTTARHDGKTCINPADYKKNAEDRILKTAESDVAEPEEAQDPGSVEEPALAATNEAVRMQSEAASLQGAGSLKKPGLFAGLKRSIIGEIQPKTKDKSSRLSEGKVDMAYLKATIQDTLKQNEVPRKVKSNLVRLPTGIEGFDETIEGGLVDGSVILLGGGPGSGKSIFGMQYLVNGIDKYDQHGVYISFEEEPPTILEDMGRFGWDLEKKIEEKKLAVLYYSPEQVDRVIYMGGGPVREVIEDIGAKRIVIDSITAFTLLYKTENERRRSLMSLFKTLKKWRCTTLLISEQTLNDEHMSVVEEYESEGVIFLYHNKRGDVRERSVEVFKMRGTNHSTKINPLKISSSGITVYPDQQVY